MPSRPVHAFTAVTVAGLAVAGATAAFLGWLSEEVIEGDTARFDAHARAVVHAAAAPWFTAFLLFFTYLGSVAVITPIFLGTVLVFWFVRWRRSAIILFVTGVGAAALDEAMKLGFHRHRPTPYFGFPLPHSFSYPSGHALFSFAFFATVAVLVTPHIARRSMRALVWAATVAVIGLIGFSRIYLGVHYPTDVIAGYATALIWVSAISLARRVWHT